LTALLAIEDPVMLQSRSDLGAIAPV